MSIRSKRRLSPEEVEDVLTVVQPIKTLPPYIAESVCENIKQGLRKQMSKPSVYPQIIPELKLQLERLYYTAQVQAGENVGIYASQTIGEKTTQLVLNSFHMSGVSEKTVTTGLPKLNELLNATQNPSHKSLTIYFKKPFRTLESLREHMWSMFPHVTLKTLMKSCKVKKRNPAADPDWYQDFELIGDLPGNVEGGDSHEWYLDYTLDQKKLFKYRLNMSTIARQIECEYSDVKAVYSPLSVGAIHVYIDTSGIDEDEEEKDGQGSNEGHRSEAERHIKHVVYNEISHVTISGYKDTEIFPVKKDGKDAEGKDTVEWILETNNGELSKILCNPLVDTTRTVSDDMWEIYDCYGREAARQFLIEEFMKTISADGEVGVRHISVMVDMMLFDGYINPDNRYGMNREQVGPLAKAAFEETVDNLGRSAVLGETDNLRGVSASIICGKAPRVGTGITEMVVDFHKLGTILEEKEGREAEAKMKLDRETRAKKERDRDEKNREKRENMEHGEGQTGSVNETFETDFIEF